MLGFVVSNLVGFFTKVITRKIYLERSPRWFSLCFTFPILSFLYFLYFRSFPFRVLSILQKFNFVLHVFSLISSFFFSVSLVEWVGYRREIWESMKVCRLWPTIRLQSSLTFNGGARRCTRGQHYHDLQDDRREGEKDLSHSHLPPRASHAHFDRWYLWVDKLLGKSYLQS